MTLTVGVSFLQLERGAVSCRAVQGRQAVRRVRATCGKNQRPRGQVLSGR